MTCTAAETLARDARKLGWTATVNYGNGQLPYTHKGDPKPNGGNFNVLIDEPVASAGVYLSRGPHRLAAFYVAREDPARRTAKGALSWSLDCAIGRKYVADGYTPTAFEQAYETVETTGRDGKAKRTQKAVGPTTLAQLRAQLAEHGQEPEPEPMGYADALFAVVDAVTIGRPNWSRKDTAA